MSTVPDRLTDVLLRPLKAELKRGEGLVRFLNPDAGDVLEQARGNVQLEPKQMASDMDISHSLVLRGLKSADDLGFHRLWQLSDGFWAELLIAIARKRDLGDVQTTFTLKRA